jgi:hypothetical protein
MGRHHHSDQAQEFYQNYLKSPKWARTKKRRLQLAGFRCEFVPRTELEDGIRCARTRYLCVHHNTYERLGNERDSDLDVFCWAHHMIEHLLWKLCSFCKEPCLLNDVVAEAWLMATLATLGIDLDAGRINWSILPTKEQLAMGIDTKCVRCRGVLKE